MIVRKLDQPHARRDPRWERHPPNALLIKQGELCKHPRMILSGWASCQRVLTDGRRQILDVALANDIVGAWVSAQSAPFDVIALTTVYSRPAPHMNNLAELNHRHLERLYDHIVRLGRQSAYERVGGLLLSLAKRINEDAVRQREEVEFPINQEVLADLLGVSVVHMNRTLQQLRKHRLIELRPMSLRILRPDQLDFIAN